ncbi:hypothetical protein OF83DRAFT_1285421 [Amylostereum chailletii]|nr:hypothetical protein OF83DRAFT_1285421 [Amylostereum chailletii]
MSVVEPSSLEITQAREIFETCETVKIPPEDPLLKFFVFDDKTQTRHSFIASSAQVYSRSVVGRSTFGYVAADLLRHKVVYLKDCWRVNLPDIPKEGSVYRRLNEAKINHIPTLLCSGDVLKDMEDDDFSLDAEDAEGSQEEGFGDGESYQDTRTQDYASADWYYGAGNMVLPHRHYRLVLDIVGRSLSTFKCTKELCVVLKDTIEAHRDAYFKADTLHRDVSPGNILITDDGHGLLIDWDLSREVSSHPVFARRAYRTATWQFVSAELLSNTNNVPHELHHDLESFAHVFVYSLARYRPTGLHTVVSTLKSVYDIRAGEDANNAKIIGGDGKVSFFARGTMRPRSFQGHINEHCTGLLEELRQIFQDALYSEDQSPAGKRDRRIARRNLATSDWLVGRFKFYLNRRDWPTNDGSIDQIQAFKDNLHSRKRKAHQTFNDDSLGHAKRRMPMLLSCTRDAFATGSTVADYDNDANEDSNDEEETTEDY